MSATATTAETKAETAVPMINVQIDGEWKQFPKGTRLIEACMQGGSYVPHYCYHPALSSPGNCRMCLIEMGTPKLGADRKPELGPDGHPVINWSPRPAISCAIEVSEGLGVRTKSPLVEECRKGVMEFLLINHPLDCPICDKAGECRLQEFSVEYGNDSSRFNDPKVKKPKHVDIGERIILDDERCILCSRCIRFMKEVAKDDVLGFVDRGGHTHLTVHPGKRLDSNYSLNTVDICPVGALTSNDFRFQMRVWFLKETKSIDVNCGTGSNITIWTRGNKVHRITPRQNDEVNSTWMPDSHRLNFHHIDGDTRLTAPMLKGSNGHQPASWSAAIAATAAELKKFQPGEVAIIASARMTNEELFQTRELAGALNCSLFTTVPRDGESDGLLISADRNPNTTGAKLVWQSQDPAGPLFAIREGVRSGSIKALLVLGEDLSDAGFTAEDLAKPEFIASIQLIAGPTANASDVVLPGASFAEKRGSMVNVTGRLQRFNRAVEPIGDAKDDWEILRDLILALQGAKPGDGPATIEDVFKAMAASAPEFDGLSLSKIGDLGKPVVETGVQIPLLQNERARKAAGLING